MTCIPDHANEILRQLDRQRKENIFTDVTVTIADRSFSAHRAVLAANSTTFMQRLQNETVAGNGNSVVFLTGVDCNAFEILLDFFYGTKLNINVENVGNVFHVSQFLHVDSVSKICEHLIASKDLIIPPVLHVDNNGEIHMSNLLHTANLLQPNTDQLTPLIDEDISDEDTLLNEQNECPTEVEILRSDDEDEVVKVEIMRTESVAGDDCDVTQEVDDVTTAAAPPAPARVTPRSSKFSCEVCLKTFATAHNLRVHNRKHTGERPFKCEKCGKKFSDPSAFRKHRLMHEGRRPFSCTQCNRRFATAANKKEHMRSHTKEKPFICKVCKKSFRYRVDLTRHQSEHNGRMYGKCKFCGKEFSHSGNYKAHVRTHERDHQENSNGMMQRFDAIFVPASEDPEELLSGYEIVDVVEIAEDSV